MNKLLSIFLPFFFLSVAAQTTIDNDSFFNLVFHFMDKGNDVVITVHGNGMIPFINDGEKVLLEKSNTFKKGDIVLAHLSNGEFVLHRILSLSDDSVNLMGDGNLYGHEFCHIDSLKALCRVKYDKHGKSISLEANEQKAKVELWQLCLPQREKFLSSYLMSSDKYWEDIFLSFMKSCGGLFFSIRSGYEIIETMQNRYLFHVNSHTIDFSEICELNESAMYLFTKAKGQTKFRLNDMVDHLLQEYEVDEQTATKDCLDLLTKWFLWGILKIECE